MEDQPLWPGTAEGWDLPMPNRDEVLAAVPAAADSVVEHDVLHARVLRPTRPVEGFLGEAGRTFRSARFQSDAVLLRVLNGAALLRRGGRGDPVRKVQQALLDLGYALPTFGADGAYGGETHTAVEAFQRDERLTIPAMKVDGIVGEQTMDRLDLAISLLRLRRDVSALSPQELTDLASAINQVRSAGIYHVFVADHARSMPTAHRQPAFLPWHRQFILNFESELQRVDASLSLPYWDWASDPGVDSAGRPMWNSAMQRLMGGNGAGATNAVTSGPFAGWTGIDASGVATPAPISRRFGFEGWATSLPTAAEVTAALAVTPYDMAPWNHASSTGGFRNALEGWAVANSLHNVVHGWVGGSMLPPTSPNDPCFFLHHCFVDRIWAEWQRRHPAETYQPAVTTPRPPSGQAAFGINDDMAVHRVGSGSPFTVKPSETLDLKNLKDHRGSTAIRVRYV